jgi:hypothetical protein
VRFLARGVEKHHKKCFGKMPQSKTFYKKVEGDPPPSIWSIAFWAVFLHDELKKAIKTF